jgi:hypothetical protein
MLRASLLVTAAFHAVPPAAVSRSANVRVETDFVVSRRRERRGTEAALDVRSG